MFSAFLIVATTSYVHGYSLTCTLHIGVGTILSLSEPVSEAAKQLIVVATCSAEFFLPYVFGK